MSNVTEDSKPRSNKHRENSRLRLLLETILRAGIQGIPWIGSSLDQLTFGFRESREFAALSKTVESLSDVVSCHLRDHPNTTLEDVPSFIDDLLNSPEVAAIEEVFDAPNPLFVTALGLVIRRIESQLRYDTANLDKSLEKLRSALEINHKTLIQEIHRAMPAQQAIGTNLGSTLDKIEHIQDYQGHVALENIYKEMSSSDKDIYLDLARLIRKSASLLSSALPRILAVDTYEILEYSLAPFRMKTSFFPLAITAMFCREQPQSRRFSIMPAIGKELRLILRRTQLDMLDYRNTVSTLLDIDNPSALSLAQIMILAEMTSPGDSPLARISKLFKRECIVDYVPDNLSESLISTISEHALSYLNMRRPGKSAANLIDSVTLAQIHLLNTQEPGCAALISGSGNMHDTAAHLASAYGFIHPVVIRPEILVTLNFLSGLEPIVREDFVTSAVGVLEIPGFFKFLQQGMERPSLDALLGAAQVAHKLQKDLRKLSLGISPFHDLLAKYARQDWQLCTALITTEHKTDFDDAYDRVYSLLSSLLGYLEPLEHAFEPFRMLSDHLARG